ncbi:hypothetical protein MKW98_007972, partial [Papaver atlanticum]
MAKAIPFATLITFFLVSMVFAQYQTGQQSQQQQIQQQEARQCRIQRGVTEIWNEFEDQFQCAGVAALKNIIHPNCLSLPNFSPSPRLVYIQQGQGLIGMSIPGCAETYHSGKQSVRGGGVRTRQTEQRDQHQKVHRVLQGDIVSLPAGVAHSCYKDGNEELVVVSSFYLAGGHQQIYSSVQSV